MMEMTMSVVVYADPSKKPEPILLGGGDTDRVTEIQGFVGGAFDCVKRGCADETGNVKPFILVGYVHDEGRILNLPLNPMASILFEQHIFGDVVLTNGTNPESGEYDGENYDIPFEFTRYLMESFHDTVSESVMFSKMLAQSVWQANAKGIISDDEMNKIDSFMREKYAENGAPAAQMGDLPEDIKALLEKALRHTFLGGDE